MAKYVPQTWTDGVSSASAARITNIENGIREASMGRSTTFPATPVDGDIHVYPADTTNGVMWMFMWRAAVSDWEFIGGAPLFHEVATSETTTSTTYADLATNGPDITIPFAGDFMVEIGFHGFQGTVARQVVMSYAIGGTAAVDADSCETDSDAASHLHSAQRVRRKAGLAASTLLRAKYRTNTSGTATFMFRWMRVIPVRHTP